MALPPVQSRMARAQARQIPRNATGQHSKQTLEREVIKAYLGGAVMALLLWALMLAGAPLFLLKRINRKRYEQITRALFSGSYENQQQSVHEPGGR